MELLQDAGVALADDVPVIGGVIGHVGWSLLMETRVVVIMRRQTVRGGQVSKA
jgi:hypothetical protein